MKGYLNILLCADGSFYTGSTNDLERRMPDHQHGKSADHTRKRLPAGLIYTEEYNRIDEVDYRERISKKRSILFKNHKPPSSFPDNGGLFHFIILTG